MKKFALIPALALLLAFAQHAQAQYTVTVGPKAAIGGTWFSGADAPDNQEFKPGVQVGGFLTYSTENILGFTIEAMYAQKGYRSNYNTSTNTDYVQRLHYVEVPVLLRFFFGDDGAKVRPNLFVGPSFNFLAQARQTATNRENTVSNTNTTDYKAFELGGVLGGGLNIRTMDNQWLDVNLRFNQGLTNINDSRTEPRAGDQYMNSGVLFSVGYGWGI